MKGGKFSNFSMKGGEGQSHQLPCNIFHANLAGVHLPKSYLKIWKHFLLTSQIILLALTPFISKARFLTHVCNWICPLLILWFLICRLWITGFRVTDMWMKTHVQVSSSPSLLREDLSQVGLLTNFKLFQEHCISGIAAFSDASGGCMNLPLQSYYQKICFSENISDRIHLDTFTNTLLREMLSSWHAILL